MIYYQIDILMIRNMDAIKSLKLVFFVRNKFFKMPLFYMVTKFFVINLFDYPRIEFSHHEIFKI